MSNPRTLATEAALLDAKLNTELNNFRLFCTRNIEKSDTEILKSYIEYRQKAVALGVAFGLVCGLSKLLLAWGAMRNGYGSQVVDLWATLYPGYAATMQGMLMGFAWGFLCGFISGVVFGWIYNLCLCCCSSSRGCGKASCGTCGCGCGKPTCAVCSSNVDKRCG